MAGEGSSGNLQRIRDLKESPAVIVHIEMMQSIINRLADNSAKCKEWCFALIGALLVFICSTENNSKIDFDIIYCIISIFCILNAYYLGLERKMVNHYRDFVININNNRPNLEKEILSPYGIDVKPEWYKRFWYQLIGTLGGFFSFSIIIPYGLLYLTAHLFNPANC